MLMMLIHDVELFDWCFFNADSWRRDPEQICGFQMSLHPLERLLMLMAITPVGFHNGS